MRKKNNTFKILLKAEVTIILLNFPLVNKQITEWKPQSKESLP